MNISPFRSDQTWPEEIECREEIDLLYSVYNNTTNNDRIVFEGKRNWSLIMERVPLGLFVVVIDTSVYTLNHKDDLHAMHSGRYAGFGPTILKSPYAVSNLLRTLLKDLPGLGIDIRKPYNVIKMN